MPRNIEFDSDTVMRGAMGEFRRHGFAGTSIKSLERATGLSSGSLYNSYGGKDDIFARALDHYNNVVVQKRIEEHLLANEPVEGIRLLFLSLLDEPEGSGCLLTNSAIEFGAGESIAKPGVEAGLDMLETAFQAAIDRLLKANGAKPGSLLARQHTYSAIRLLALYQGILVLVRFGRPVDQLRNLINNEINQLTGMTT